MADFILAFVILLGSGLFVGAMWIAWVAARSTRDMATGADRKPPPADDP